MARLIDLVIVVAVWVGLLVLFAAFGTPGSVETAGALVIALAVMLLGRKRRHRTAR